MSVNVLLVCGYSAFLLGVAYGFDLMARRVAVRAQRWRTGSFRYHADHDAWTCPEDQWLWPASFDPEQRIVRYRAKPSVCNSCPVKSTCTTSHSGREVQRAVDTWPASEAARFHRWIACSVVLLGLVWPVAVALTDPGRDALLVLAVAVVVALILSLPLWSHLRRSSTFMPEGMVHRSLDQAVQEREAVAATQLRHRAAYHSDRRPADRAGS